MEIEKAKAAAISNASKVVAGYLSRPDQLDKVEQIRRRIMRNKASVDSRLKTAVQSQVDGIRSGLNELKSATTEINEMKKIINEINVIFTECRPLNAKLDHVMVAHNKHAKLSKTNAHLKQIFNVPETIAKSKQLISESKFLQSHKNIMELEATRDDLLLELHKLSVDDPHAEPVEQSPIYAYFAEVDELSKQLAKQLWTVIDRTLSAARSNPTQLVTALRVIEREERSDKRCLDQQKTTGFLPPGRPKCLREHCLSTLRKSVNNRFDSNQMELIDKTKKMWLVRHLERMRAFILEDLLTIKHLVRPCFPPSYNIFKRYVQLYHTAASRTLEEFALNQTNPNECVMLLSWINDYDGPQLLGHEELKEHIDEFKKELDPVLSDGVIDSLMDTYVTTTERNMQSWLQKMAETESQDWLQDKPPETDSGGFYQTSLAIILFQMLDQNLQVGAFIKQNVKLKIVDVAVRSLNSFIKTYKDLIINFKMKYFENRSATKFFEPYMVAIANNCLSISEFSEQMRGQLKAELGEETFGIERANSFTVVVKGYEKSCYDVCSLLLDSALADLEQYFLELMSRKWFGSKTIVDTIIVTLEDYLTDYSHLRSNAFNFIMSKAQERIVIEYVKACMSKRMVFRNADERRDGAVQLIAEANRIANAFTNMANLPSIEKTPCYVLLKIAEVLKVTEAEDRVVLTLELSGLASLNKDFQMDHALALLALRGDMGRIECRQTVSQINFQVFDESVSRDGLVFWQCPVAATVLDKLESKLQGAEKRN